MRGVQDFGPGLSSLIAAAPGGAALVTDQSRKMVAASVSLGSGASLGPEGPSVEISANFGMLLGPGAANVSRATTFAFGSWGCWLGSWFNARSPGFSLP